MDSQANLHICCLHATKSRFFNYHSPFDNVNTVFDQITAHAHISTHWVLFVSFIPNELLFFCQTLYPLLRTGSTQEVKYPTVFTHNPPPLPPTLKCSYENTLSTLWVDYSKLDKKSFEIRFLVIKISLYGFSI